jgi:hypothetical protein
MREIQGLTKRLQDLNALLDESARLLASQSEISDGMAQNCERATRLNDESVLVDLCKGHERQLEVFKSNHVKMIEITNRISKAKLELIRVVHFRLHWVMQIQKQMCDYDFQLQLNFKQLKRLNVRIKLMEHLKQAPHFYLYSLKETVRRRKFSASYKSLANALKILIKDVYASEMKRRENFDSKASLLLSSSSSSSTSYSSSSSSSPSSSSSISSSSANTAQNFILSILFRGLNDKVQSFLCDVELGFDDDLPRVSQEDVWQVEGEIRSFLLARSNTGGVNNFNSGTSSSSTTSSSSSCNQFETNSPTPTIILSPNQPQKTPDNTPTTTTTTTTCHFYQNLINQLELTEETQPKQHQISDKNMLLVDSLTKLINNPNTNPNTNPQLTLQTIQDLKLKLVEAKDLILRERVHFDETAANLIKMQTDFAQKTTQDKRKLIATIESVLNQNEKVPNEKANSEEEDRDDLTRELCHLIRQTQRETLKEREKLVCQMNADKQKFFNEAIKRATQDKERQCAELRQKEIDYIEEIRMLKESLNVYKTTSASTAPIQIQQDANVVTEINTTNNTDLVLVEDLANLNETKNKLKEIMYKEKIEQLEKRLSLLSTLPVTNDYETIQLNSCNIDDLVIAIFSEEHNSYKIIHKSSTYLHFVHSAIFKSHEQKLSFKVESLNGKSSPTTQQPPPAATDLLDQSLACQFDNTTTTNLIMSNFSTADFNFANLLSTSPSTSTSTKILVKNSPSDNIDSIFLKNEQPQWFIGRVLVKEFCIARRENNRFKVPSGTRFYRVKLKPYNLNQ